MTLLVTSRPEVHVEPFFDSNRDSNAGELWRTLANDGETADFHAQLQNERWRTVANVGERWTRELQN